MRAGILSINLHTRKLNYGAALHSWVFRKVVMRRDDIDSCEVIDYLPAWAEREDPRRQYLHNLSLRHPGDALRRMRRTARFVRRYNRFRRYFSDHLDTSARQYTRASLERAELPYDLLFLEGDVIWAPTYFGDTFDPVYFGAAGALRDIPSIAYGPSMSDAKMEAAHYPALRELLRYPRAISVREGYAAEILRGLTDKPVTEVVDSVLLARAEDFDEITSPRRRVEGDYLLLFFPTQANEKVTADAVRYAKAKGLTLVEVSDRLGKKGGHRVFADLGVEDFLSLVRHAKVIFTTSLHGVCLSMLFHRDFYAMRRPGGNHKTEALCGQFGLTDRFQDEGAFHEQPPIDWDAFDALLERRRAESMQWLDRAIRDASRAQGGL